MFKSIYKIVFVFVTILIASCESKVKEDHKIEVKHAGALKTIMSGDIQSAISLDSLSNKKNLYALGAMEKLKGEIQIFNSKPSNSRVIDSSLQVNNSYNLNASLLVYAEVEAWNEFRIENIGSKENLEMIIFETARAQGINIEKPFPFLLKGVPEYLDWHVIDWVDGDTLHTHKKHKESGLNDRITKEDIEIVGFYSTKHKAVFTHHSTNIHMHFKTTDNSVAAHIDDLELNTVVLSLPK